MIKSMSKRLVAAAILSTVSVGVFAAEGSKLSAGVKLGSIESNSGFGLNVGYSFSDKQSVELDYLMHDLVDVTAVYWAYRSADDLYFIGKGGIANFSTNAFDYSVSDVGLSLGLGGGYKINDSLTVEAQYTTYDTTTFNGISLGVNYHF